MIVVVISVAIVMLIQIRRRSGIIVCYMIQILVYLLTSFQKQQLLKKAWKKAGLLIQITGKKLYFRWNYDAI